MALSEVIVKGRGKGLHLLSDVPITGGRKLSKMLHFRIISFLQLLAFLREHFPQGNRFEQLILNSVIVNRCFKHLC